MKQSFLCQVFSLVIVSMAFTACNRGSGDKNAERCPVRVKTVTVGNSGIENSCTYSGTVEEDNATVVSFSAAGTIKTLNISEGDRIAKGQLIGTLDDGSLKNAYEIALAALDQARDAYDRLKLLHDSNSLADIKWVEMESKLRQAEGAAEIARIALEDAKLRSPVSGVVSEKMASIGQTVAPGVPVVKIVSIKNVKVSISLPENEISLYPLGTPAIITSVGSADETYHGELVEKGVSANPLSRTYAAKFQVDNSEGKLLPGMICDLTVSCGSNPAGIILPVSSVMLSADNSNFVWIDSCSTARRRAVVAGAMLPEGIVIESGLNEGDNVIVSGMDKVSTGTKVESVK